jgi:GDPmannose 4,6-dehydratase
VREFILWSAEALGIKLEFDGAGVEEVGRIVGFYGEEYEDLAVGDIIVRIDPHYYRPAEVDTLLGDPTKAKRKLGWEPTITAREMCKEMIQNDLREARDVKLIQQSRSVP